MQPLLLDERTGLMYRRWRAASPKAVFLLVHGLGAHSGRWEDLAEFFVPRGFSVYAIELRGFGETKGVKGHVDGFGEYYGDIRRLSDIIKEENPGRELFILGESMGGLIACEMAALYPDLFDGIVCVSPAFASRLKFSVLDYAKMAAALVFRPQRQFRMPFNGSMCTRDTEHERMLDTNHREHRVATPRLLMGIFAAQVRSAFSRKNITRPVLFLLAGEDRLVGPKMSERVFRKLRAADKKIIRYPEMYHCLTIDTGREKVFADVTVWAEERIKG